MYTNNNYGFMYLGATREIANSAEAFKVPFPDSPSIFESELAFDGNRNALNVLVGQFVGRQIDKQNCTWGLLPAETWWALNRFRRDNRNTFYCRYFDHNLGEWHTRVFYTGNPRTDILIINEIDGKPVECYKTSTLNFIDTGEGE